jgi:hypothetical protein
VLRRPDSVRRFLASETCSARRARAAPRRPAPPRPAPQPCSGGTSPSGREGRKDGRRLSAVVDPLGGWWWRNGVAPTMGERRQPDHLPPAIDDGLQPLHAMTEHVLIANEDLGHTQQHATIDDHIHRPPPPIDSSPAVSRNAVPHHARRHRCCRRCRSPRRCPHPPPPPRRRRRRRRRPTGRVSPRIGFHAHRDRRQTTPSSSSKSSPPLVSGRHDDKYVFSPPSLRQVIPPMCTTADGAIFHARPPPPSSSSSLHVGVGDTDARCCVVTARIALGGNGILISVTQPRTQIAAWGTMMLIPLPED